MWTEVFTEEEIGTPGQQGCVFTEKRPHEVTVRRWTPASLGERPWEKPTLPTPRSWVLVSRNVRK